MNAEFAELLAGGAKELGVILKEREIDLFYRYMNLIEEWNERFNLTAISGQHDMVVKHFLDSLSIVKYFPGDAETFLDVGTGAGFPGIPVKLAVPHLHVVLLESVGKKVGFLEEVISALSLEKIKAVKGRAEELGRMKEYRESFDLCAARAVAPLNILLEYTLPFVKVGGRLIAMKGKDAGEINQAQRALDILGGRVEKVESMILPGSDMTRNIILIKKFRQTPPSYPRKSGKPSKQPLI
jgi:16S rRNA (guanine527-N7)-methyltransferase